MATLVVVGGPAEGQKFALEEHGLVMVGRDHDCTFQVLDPQISRRHFQVKRDAATGGHCIIDFNSANGVILNEQRIAVETPLQDGDLIRIGGTSILYSMQDAPDAQTVTRLLRKHGEGRFKTIVRE